MEKPIAKKWRHFSYLTLPLFMRILTAMAAFALLFSACGKQEVGEPVIDLKKTDLHSNAASALVGFYKVVDIDGEFIPAEDGQFEFELWDLKKDELIGTYPTLNGGVFISFNDLNPNREYMFREVPVEGYEPLEDLPFYVEASSKSAVWAEDVTFEVVEGEFGEMLQVINVPIQEEVVFGEAESGLTLTNDVNDPYRLINANSGNEHHFCYAVLNVTELAEGITLDIVKGNNGNENFEKFGEAVVKLNAEGRIEIIVEDPEVSFKAEAYDEVPEWNNNGKDKNVFPVCPEGEVVYLYVFFDSVRFPVE